ncbi:MAG: PAS domain S-box protein, partial [Chitinophagaceae bacterium]
MGQAQDFTAGGGGGVKEVSYPAWGGLWPSPPHNLTADASPPHPDGVPSSSPKQMMTGPTRTAPAYPTVAELRQLFDASPDVLCVLDPGYRFTAVSAACRALWGYAPEDLLGRHLFDGFHPADAAAARRAVDSLQGGAPGTSFEARQRCADGSFAPVLWSVHRDASGTLYAAGRPAGDGNAFRSLVLLQQEALLHRQQEIEEELRRSNERFRLAARSDAIYDWDLSSHKLHWGEGLYAIFGYQEAELQMEQWIAALHPAESAALLAGLDASLHNPAAGNWEAEYQLRRPDGSWSFVHERGHILRDPAGKATRMVGRIEDISERKRRETELRKLSLITEQTEDAIVVTNAQKETTWVNAAFTRLTGYSLEDMLGRRPAAVLEGPAPDPALLERVDAYYRAN